MSDTRFRTTVGKRIKQERLKLGLTQEELAEKAEIHPSFVGQIERGLRAASFKTLERLGAIFHIKTSDFLDYAPKPDDPKQYSMAKRIMSLLKGCSAREQQMVYQTIKHLLRQNRKLAK